MSLLPLFEWMQSTSVGTAIRNSATLIALVEIVHLIGLTLLVGSILMVDLSLAGWGFRRYPVSQVARELASWMAAGLVVMLVSGPVMLSSEALRCYRTPSFWVKMALLLVALLFHFTIHRRAALAEPPAGPWRARAIAATSLGLWIGVALAGKAIAIFQPE